MNKYEYVKKIGFGAFGSVFLVTNLDTNEKLCVKICRYPHVYTLNQEISILQSLSHPNIVNFHSVNNSPISELPTDNFSKTMLITEYIDGSDIFYYLKISTIIEQSTIKKCIIDICDALIYLESVGVVHRDIKPENIVEYSGGFKLIDFGLAIRISDYNKKTESGYMGSPIYFAPELLLSQTYNHATDLWALVATIYNLILKRHAFNAVTLPELEKKLKYLRYHKTKNDLYNKIFRSVFVSDPSLRINSAQLKQYATENL